MASNASARTMDSLNPCCVLWKTRYSKMEEKRNALRQGVEILKGQIDRLQLENVNLKKACDEEQARLNIVKEEKGKEASLRISMEQEIAALKSEISSAKPEVASGKEDLNKEATLLRACISEREVEIDCLKQLLAEEKMRADTEKNAADLEKKSVVELQKSLEYEKSRADEASKMSDTVGIKAEEDRLQLDSLKREAEKTSFKLEEANRKLEAERQRTAKQKRCADEEKARAMEQRRIAEANEKRVMEEKCRANDLLMRLEEEKQKVEKLQKDMKEMMSSQRSVDSSELNEVKGNLQMEKKKVASEKRYADEEKARVGEQIRISEAKDNRLMEEKSRVDNLLMQLEEEKKKVEKLQKGMEEVMSSQRSAYASELEEVKRNLETEKNNVAREKRYVEEEKARVMEQIRIAEANEKRLMEEKSRADNLLMQLEEEKKKGEKLQNEMEKVLSSQISACTSELDEVKGNLETEKNEVAREKRFSEEEKARMMVQIRISDANEKRIMEEKTHADNLLMQLGEEKKKVEKLQKEMEEVMSSRKSAYTSELEEVKRHLEIEKKKVAREKKRADLEMSKKEEQEKLAQASIEKAMKEKCHADKLSKDLQDSRGRLENLERELNKVNDMLGVERKEAAKEKKHAELEKLKSEEQGRIAIENEKRAIEEKWRGDNLFQELESARQKLHDLENELSEFKLCRSSGGALSVPSAFVVNEQTARVNLLHEQLKFEKKRVKHAKQVAKLEKGRNSILQQEQHRLRQEFQSLLHHLESLSDTFGARNGVKNMSKLKSSLSNMPSAQLLGRMCSPSDMFGDAELGMSSLSSMDTSCHLKPNIGLVHAGHCMESTSASFSDEQWIGSQERLAGSLTTSTGLSAENTKPQASIPLCSNKCCKQNDSEKVGGLAQNGMRNPIDTATGHFKKRRKILHELESIKYMHLEGKRIFQEAEKKFFALHNALIQPVMDEQLEKRKFPLLVSKAKSCGKSGWSSKKRKASHEPEVILQQVDESNVQMEVDKLESLAPTVLKTREHPQPLCNSARDLVKCNQDDLTSFEQVMKGDYMKLLDLDNAVAEECFRMALDRPLSPTLPDIDLRDFEKKVEAQASSVQMSGIKEARDQHGCSIHNKDQIYFILFSDMQDINSVTRIFHATRNCVARCCLFLQTNWLVQDILAALLLEKDLKPREKACVLLSLMILNFAAVSSSKCGDFHSHAQMDSFSTHVNSVLLNLDTRDLFTRICDVSEFLALSEDFVINRKILSHDNMTSKLPNACGSSIEILHEGQKIVLSPKTASTNLVMAGSTVLASICKAVGHIGCIREVSLKILLMYGAEYSLALSILHTLAYICGEEYVTMSDYSLVMKVVKSMVTFIEGFLATNTNVNLQPLDNTLHGFTPCDRCPFSEGSVTLDDVSSELLEELQRHTVPQISADLAHSSNRESLSCVLGDVLSSLELITSKMGWEWVCSRIVPKLLKMLELCDQERIFSTALVVLLGDLGRLGVETCGYDDAAIESIKCQLSGMLCRTATSKCNSPLAMAIAYALVGLYPKDHEVFQKSNTQISSKDGLSASTASNIIREFLSSLSGEQISSLIGLVNLDTGVAA